MPPVFKRVSDGQLRYRPAGVDTSILSEFTVSTTGNIDNLDFGNANLIRFTNASDSTLRGLVAGVAGQQVTIVSAGAGSVFLAHQDTNSTAANRLLNNVVSDVTPLSPGNGKATYQYDGTTNRWRLAVHTQGSAILVPFVSGDYTANGAMTWAGNNGSPEFFAYYYLIVGNLMIVTLALDSGTIGGTPNIECRLKLPKSYAVTQDTANLGAIKDNGSSIVGRYKASAGLAYISLTRLDQANYSLQATLQFFGQLKFFIT